ncbi:MAG: DUF1772 domain-containing protein [Roseiflexaceae bacterium]|nr:DUF1772 domain-containing protein [Roseiflexaceae bacterium]
MRDIRIAHIVYTFGVGLFAGLLYTFAQGVIPTLNMLNASEYTKVEQGLITSLDGLPISVILVATISMLLPLYPLIKLWKQRGTTFWRLTFVGWLLFCFGVSVFTIVLNVPINNYVQTWDSAQPPADWQNARDSWNMLNSIRTPINYISFLLLLWASFELPRAENS